MRTNLKLVTQTGATLLVEGPRDNVSFMLELGDQLEYFAREHIPCPESVSDAWGAVAGAVREGRPLDCYELETVEIALKEASRHKAEGFIVDLSDVGR